MTNYSFGVFLLATLVLSDIYRLFCPSDSPYVYVCVIVCLISLYKARGGVQNQSIDINNNQILFYSREYSANFILKRPIPNFEFIAKKCLVTI